MFGRCAAALAMKGTAALPRKALREELLMVSFLFAPRPLARSL
jgi:hypothetical protein